jgi:hypothetical protein
VMSISCVFFLHFMYFDDLNLADVVLSRMLASSVLHMRRAQLGHLFCILTPH